MSISANPEPWTLEKKIVVGVVCSPFLAYILDITGIGNVLGDTIGVVILLFLLLSPVWGFIVWLILMAGCVRSIERAIAETIAEGVRKGLGQR